MSRGFLLIGASLFERIGRWDGRRFYVDVGAGSYNWGVFYASVYWCALSVPEWCSAGRYWGGGMWSSAVYKGGLFMGYDNGELRAWNGTGDPGGVLVFRMPNAIFSVATDGVCLYLGTCGDAVGYGARSSGIADVRVYDGNNVFLISLGRIRNWCPKDISSVSVSPRQQVIKC